MRTHLNGRFAVVCFAIGVLAAFSVMAVKRAHGDGTEPAKAASEVKIDNFTYNAATITVPVGTEVTWVNRDDIPHTVTSQDNLFKSRALDTDEKFTFKFSQAGTYRYFCSIHPKMTAEVVVK